LKKKFLIIMFFVICATFAQEEIADTSKILSVSETDSLVFSEENPEIPDTKDSQEEKPEIPKDDEIAETNKKISPYISFSPLIGVDNIQKEYAQFLKRRADTLYNQVRKKEQNSRFVSKWLQPAAASGVSFYFETGISLNIDEKYAATIATGYSFNRMKSVCLIDEYVQDSSFVPPRTDSLQALKSISTLANNTFLISANFKAVFDTSYFSIKGMDAAGFYGKGIFLYSLYLERDAISSRFDEFAENRRESYSGFGGGASFGLFARKKLAKRSVFEYSIGYLFSMVVGYDDFWDRKFFWENPQKADEIRSISNSLILSLSLIF